jgi:hypothetical protein
LEEAMKIGLDIADALDKAHQSGIVHRDLKPGNIMLTPAGTKLLDFGLAKLGPERGGALVDVTAPPTDESPLTADGVILGTLQYMAPEQLEGEEADARTDIFAFGTVLYEMVTRRRAFEGKSQAGLMASILSSTPPPASGLARGAPAALDHVIERCLAKDPAQRWQNARDLWMELKWAADPSRQVEKAAPRRGRILPIALAIGIVVAAAVASILYFRSAGTVPAAESRFEIPVVGLASPFYISISPDGRRVAYLAAASNGKTALWVRPLNSLDAQLLTGTEGASTADWSGCGCPGALYAGYCKSRWNDHLWRERWKRIAARICIGRRHIRDHNVRPVSRANGAQHTVVSSGRATLFVHRVEHETGESGDLYRFDRRKNEQEAHAGRVQSSIRAAGFHLVRPRSCADGASI